MSADYDYLSFRDDILIGVADLQEPPGLFAVEIGRLVEQLGIAAQPSWIMLVAKDLADQGFGRDQSTLKSHTFLLNGKGLARATELRRERQASGPLETSASIDWTKWGTILAGVGIAVTILVALIA